MKNGTDSFLKGTRVIKLLIRKNLTARVNQTVKELKKNSSCIKFNKIVMHSSKRKQIFQTYVMHIYL